jgi:hypothetical protein
MEEHRNPRFLNHLDLYGGRRRLIGFGLRGVEIDDESADDSRVDQERSRR